MLSDRKYLWTLWKEEWVANRWKERRFWISLKNFVVIVVSGNMLLLLLLLLLLSREINTTLILRKIHKQEQNKPFYEDLLIVGNNNEIPTKEKIFSLDFLFVCLVVLKQPNKRKCIPKQMHPETNAFRNKCIPCDGSISFLWNSQDSVFPQNADFSDETSGNFLLWNLSKTHERYFFLQELSTPPQLPNCSWCTKNKKWINFNKNNGKLENEENIFRKIFALFGAFELIYWLQGTLWCMMDPTDRTVNRLAGNLVILYPGLRIWM